MATPPASTVVRPALAVRPGPGDDEDLADLLQRSADADRHAFTRLYDATAPRLLGLAIRVLRDHAQAEEVVQDTYLHAWTHAARFDPARGTAIAWLLMIVHGRAVGRVRSAEARRRREAGFEQLTAPTRAAGDATSEAAVAVLEASRLRTALGTLSPGQQEALGLAYDVGLSHAEVAARLGLPLGTVKARIRSGLRRLALVLA